MNCSQIFCTFAVETTRGVCRWRHRELWIALKFFVLLQSKQPLTYRVARTLVVNCSQIFCTFAVETTIAEDVAKRVELWIALKFFVLLQSKQRIVHDSEGGGCCELLSNFLYFCSRNNLSFFHEVSASVVNCSQIFCTFAVETTGQLTIFSEGQLWIALKFFVLLQSKQPTGRWRRGKRSCELLSNFLYFCSRNNYVAYFSLLPKLWIALKFFVLLQSKQPTGRVIVSRGSCELLSNFLYFCSRNNP